MNSSTSIRCSKLKRGIVTTTVLYSIYCASKLHVLQWSFGAQLMTITVFSQASQVCALIFAVNHNHFVQSLAIGRTVYDIPYRIYLTKERHVLCSLYYNHFKLRIAVSKQFIASGCTLFSRTLAFTLLAVEVEFLCQSHQVLHTL